MKFDIRYIESIDRLNWPDRGRLVLQVSLEQEHGSSRSCILKNTRGHYIHHLIQKRNPARYCLDSAALNNDIDWIRKDNNLGVYVSNSKFENDAHEYGAEISTEGKKWFLYNENDFGGDGLCMVERIS